MESSSNLSREKQLINAGAKIQKKRNFWNHGKEVTEEVGEEAGAVPG